MPVFLLAFGLGSDESHVPTICLVLYWRDSGLLESGLEYAAGAPISTDTIIPHSCYRARVSDASNIPQHDIGNS